MENDGVTQVGEVWEGDKIGKKFYYWDDIYRSFRMDKLGKVVLLVGHWWLREPPTRGGVYETFE
jgi:hypothetical protein